MRILRVELGERSYEIKIGSGSLGGIGEELKRLGTGRRTAIVSNPTVYGLYGARVSGSLKRAGFEVSEIIIPDGERYKDFLWTYRILGELLKAGLDRASILVALGGGVIGDITGFAASIYMRGIDYVQVPTTLLAQVDSSVGGKTGVNHRLGKNMIGTFWQPRLVWIDTGTLSTLPKREFLAGAAEVIKYGVIWDGALFDFLEKNQKDITGLQDEAISHVIARSCVIKADVVSRDERESGLRAILNYGHTVGHAIETLTGYEKYLHGEAVAVGMHIEARLSEKLGFLDAHSVSKIRGLISAYGLPTEMEEGLKKKEILRMMALDKKTVSGELTFILPEKIGAVRIEKGVEARPLLEVLP